jgi:YegS/Rv2252/BmrU family lipid kinase
MALDSATLMVNPAARGVPSHYDWTRPQRFLQKRGIDTRLVIPSSPKDARCEAAQSARAGDRWLFVVGGDGSLRVAAAGLAGSQTALAALPMGTVNVWARETSIPPKLKAALETHLSGRIERIDIGRAGDEPFLLMASAGWDAEVARDVSPSLKRKLGDLAYVLQGIRSVRQLHGQPVEWSADGHRSHSHIAPMVISNTRLYGGRVMFTPDARATDGVFDYVALMPRHPGDTIGLAVRLVMRRLSHALRVKSGRARAISIDTPGIAVQLDGDYVGETPMTFTIEPRALAVSLPGGPLPAILAAPAFEPHATDGTIWQPQPA